MNWSEVAEKYPKANDAWWKYYYETEFDVEISAWIDDERPDSLIGHLLAFFDEHEIWVASNYGWGYGFSAELKHGSGEESSHEHLSWFKIRPEALTAAFTKAFEVLEGGI